MLSPLEERKWYLRVAAVEGKAARPELGKLSEHEPAEARVVLVALGLRASRSLGLRALGLGLYHRTREPSVGW